MLAADYSDASFLVLNIPNCVLLASKYLCPTRSKRDLHADNHRRAPMARPTNARLKAALYPNPTNRRPLAGLAPGVYAVRVGRELQPLAVE